MQNNFYHFCNWKAELRTDGFSHSSKCHKVVPHNGARIGLTTEFIDDELGASSGLFLSLTPLHIDGFGMTE